jgi:hypothetical protein
MTHGEGLGLDPNISHHGDNQGLAWPPKQANRPRKLQRTTGRAAKQPRRAWETRNIVGQLQKSPRNKQEAWETHKKYLGNNRRLWAASGKGPGNGQQVWVVNIESWQWTTGPGQQ